MTTRKIMGIVTLVMVVGIGLFIFILYATIKTKSTNISSYPPFREWIDKTVTLNKETTVFEEKIKMNANSKYAYLLLDSLHPRWEYIYQQEEIGDVTEVAVIPAGAKLTVEKAVQYTNGVSGSSSPTIFGTINNGEKVYKVGYQWGTWDMSRSFSDPEPWHFHQAPWQMEQDTTHYALPTAAWW